jgi:hypothetical protein
MNKPSSLDKKLVGELGKALSKAGFSELHVRQLINSDLLSKIKSVFLGAAKIVPTKFKLIEVDYRMNFDEMIAAGNFAWKSNKITSESLPIQKETDGKVVFETVEFFFNWGISSEKAKKEIANEDPDNPWQPAKIEHMLAYSAQHPEQQMKYPIIGLGSIAKIGDRNFVPRLYRGGTDPFLFLYANDWDGGWGPLCRFLAVRKTTKKSEK